MKKAFKSALSLLLCMIMIIGTLITTIAAKGNDSSQAAIEQDGLRLESTNAVGKVLAKAASEQVESSESYGIVGVDINGSTIAVEINNADACTVLVAVYDDDSGRMVGSGFCNVEQNAGNVDVELNISSLPDYYLLRAFLLDDELASLCEEYRDIEHTHNFIEAKEKTVDDFPDNIVFNLDETKDNNFAVVADNGVEITTDGVKNVLISSENDIYEFNNIDSQFDSLKDGDVISYTDGDKSSFVIKISAINIQGDKAIINSDTDASIDELFDFLKVDVGSDGDGEKMSVDMDGVEDGITYEGMEKFDEMPRQSPAKAPQKSKVDVSSTLDCPVWNISKKFGYTGDGSGIGTGEASIEFKLQIKVGISYSLKAYYDADWEWKWDFWNSLKTYYYFESTFDFSAKATGSVTGKLSKEFYLGAIDFVTPCGITCGIGFRLVFAATGSISLDIQKYSFKIGFRYDNESGFRNLSSKPEKEVMPSLSGEISVSLSLKASPNISLIKIVEVAINPEAGIRITGVPLSVNPVDVITGKPDESKVHTCSLCIDGSIKLFYTVSVSGRIFAKKASITLVSTQEWTVAKFYYSASTGKLEFGKTCPNILYCVTFTVVGKDGKALEGASVNIGDGALYKFENGKPVKVGGKVAVTDDKGVAKAYYANGKHTATASKDNSEYSVSFTVMNAEKELKVKLNVSGTNPNPNPGGDTDPTPTPGILDKLTYEIEDGKVTITDCDNSLSGDIVLPSKIEGKPVTSIGDDAFSDCSSLTSVTIGNGVTSIGTFAFDDCSSLTSITIPNSVTSIGWTFNGCDKLNQINVDTANTVYSSVNGVLFNKDKTELIRYPEGKTDTSYSIPDSVTSIGGNAFEYCTSLRSVTIPDSVTSIGDSAFFDCSNLTGIAIPQSVTDIGNGAFQGCVNLTDITIPDMVNSILGNPFLRCSKLTKINVSNLNSRYSSIDGVLFDKSELSIVSFPPGKSTTYTIPNIVTDIGAQAFSHCNKLTSISIPQSVTSIDTSAFWYSESLKQINVATSNSNYSSVDGVLFNKLKTELIICPPGKIGDYSIPNGTHTVGRDAFLGCEYITKVSIPKSVTSIEDSAFYQCFRMAQVLIYNYAVSFGNGYAFGDCYSLKDVYYAGTQEQWKKTSPYTDNDLFLPNVTIHYNYFSTQKAQAPKAIDINNLANSKSTVYTATAQNAVPGELYMLYAFSSDTDLSSLEYVAQLRAESSEVEFRYIPRNLGDLNVVIVGKFSDGSAQEPVEPEYGVERLVLISLPAKTKYDYISSPVADLSGLRLKAVYSDGAEKEITDLQDIKASEVDTSKLGDQEITLTYEGVSIQIAVTVVPRKFKLVWIVDGSQTELTAAEGSKITKPADPELEGYVFKGWSPEVPETMPAQDIIFTARFEPVKCSVIVPTPPKSTLNYGETLVLKAYISSLPTGARIVWKVVGRGAEIYPAKDGRSCEIKATGNGKVMILATVVDNQGVPLTYTDGSRAEGMQEITTKDGLFLRIVAFFKKLFGSDMVIPYALEWIVK